jgi:hypothetical protein
MIYTTDRLQIRWPGFSITAKKKKKRKYIVERDNTMAQQQKRGGEAVLFRP